MIPIPPQHPLSGFLVVSPSCVPSVSSFSISTCPACSSSSAPCPWGGGGGRGLVHFPGCEWGRPLAAFLLSALMMPFGCASWCKFCRFPVEDQEQCLWVSHSTNCPVCKAWLSTPLVLYALASEGETTWRLSSRLSYFLIRSARSPSLSLRVMQAAMRLNLKFSLQLGQLVVELMTQALLPGILQVWRSFPSHCFTLHCSSGKIQEYCD